MLNGLTSLPSLATGVADALLHPTEASMMLLVVLAVGVRLWRVSKDEALACRRGLVFCSQTHYNAIASHICSGSGTGGPRRLFFFGRAHYTTFRALVISDHEVLI